MCSPKNKKCPNCGLIMSYNFVTCECPGLDQNWEINMTHHCNITTNCDLGTGMISFVDEGWVNCSAILNTSGFGDPGSGGTFYISKNGEVYII